jgi:hypothetical protein
MRGGAADAALHVTPPPGVERPAFAAAFPALFVVLWSTGFIAAKYGVPYAPPLTFLLLRFALVAALMTVVALATRAAWPNRREIVHLARHRWCTARISPACGSPSRAACPPARARCSSGCSRC